VTRDLSGTRVSHCFPKDARILRSSDFRKVYDAGVRISGPYFAAFCLRVEREDGGPRIGFTVARAFGRAVKRNRARRRIREALRLRFSEIAPHWDIVVNPRRQVLTATPGDLRREVERLVLKCAN
jgi:ribonuclease P protein component